MLKLLNWRNVYLLTIPIRIILTLSNSYIHPDEHFQSIEIISNKILGYSTNISWEFNNDFPARSFVPLYFIYGPLLYVIKFLNLNLTPIQIWYLLRLQICLINWVIIDFCLYWMLPTKHERIKALFFTSTSFVSLVFQNHLFSNSIETCLLIFVIYIIDDLRYIQENKELKSMNKTKSLLTLGALISFGIFNRITFPAFIILPSWYLLTYIYSNLKSIIPLTFGFIIPTISFIYLDTYLYNSNSFVIAPLNNLLYNSKFENLSNHGIHPYYTHVLVNVPQLLGPGLIFMISKNYIRTTPFLTILSGLFFLSIFPHQELRFLIPLLPLCCCCFDLTQKFVKPWMIYIWYVFNVVMSLLMGIFHQGGIIPALEYIRENDLKGIHIWKNTYSPPSWLLGSDSVETVLIGQSLNNSKEFTIIDAMGSSINDVIKELNDDRPTYLITPLASYTYGSHFKPLWNTTFHIELDHLDNFQLGLGIYQMI
ncbi:SMP3 [Candida pseudojiufengensis]|uniref:SMP3 n=1 Tax=Candida pseudojiufengensis TaxID=497109 RepID=UPI0022240919|nr:SMP3 [Candida pseudojiufengensis]KAI5964753.1 SMP3 [Candida pseudojiufengensis]